MECAGHGLGVWREMNWQIERDNAGRPIRMWWMGSGGKPKQPDAPVNRGCPDCGMPNGWHKRACARSPVIG